MPHTFFFSYARADSVVDPLLKRFYEELSAEVATRGAAATGEPAGFLDGGIPTGADSVLRIARAVGSCKVFVPIYSPNYFDREFTGQEWQAFDQRLAVHEQATGRRPDAVVPVWWLPPRRDLPMVAGPLQHPFDQVTPEFRTRGLRYLLQRKASRDDYYKVLVDLTERILRAADDPPGPATFTDVSRLPNAFARPADEAPQRRDAAGAPVAGPRHVTFLVAAGGRGDMQLLRSDLEVYGDDWADWRPYHPVCSDRIAVRAQQEASSQDMTSAADIVTGAIFETLERAKERNELVVVLLDPWALHLPQYEALLARLDGVRSQHAAVLVPWEPGHVPPTGHGTALQDKLIAVLGGWADAGEYAYRGELTSIEVFADSLQQVLMAVRARVVSRAEVARRAAEAGPSLRPSLAPYGG